MDLFIGQICCQGNTHLWYLATLFLIFIIAYYIEKYIKCHKFAKLAVLLFLSLISSKIRINLISYVFQYTFWFYMGFYFEPRRLELNKKINRKSVIVAMIILALVYCIYLLFDGANFIFLKIVARLTKFVLT